jgi:hypothetical protein
MVDFRAVFSPFAAGLPSEPIQRPACAGASGTVIEVERKAVEEGTGFEQPLAARQSSTGGNLVLPARSIKISRCFAARKAPILPDVCVTI